MQPDQSSSGDNDDTPTDPVGGWKCGHCGRLFGRAKQSHDCAPGLTIEEYFSTGPQHERPVFDAVMAHLTKVGPVHLDIVSVGIFLKNPTRFAQLRPLQRWVAISFSLSRRATHKTITRQVNEYGGRYWHVANVARPEELDEPLLELLTQAYLETVP